DRRGRSAVRPGGGDRRAQPARLDFPGAAASANRLQPRCAPAGGHGARRLGVRDAIQREPRDPGAGTGRGVILLRGFAASEDKPSEAQRAKAGKPGLLLVLLACSLPVAWADSLQQLRDFLTQTQSARGDFSET